MAPGDTQEIVVGVVAGLGSDRLSSVAVMKFNDRFVQNTFNALFQVPAPPSAPDVKFSELDGEVTLEWGSNLTRVSDTETRTNQPGAYIFEGYNVYQLPSRGSPLNQAKRIVTYDLPSDPAVVIGEQFDESSGQILVLPFYFGSNSGLTRYFDFKRDYIKDFDKIFNGQEYYLAVTAYSRSTIPGYLPAGLESSPIVLTVRPQGRGAGMSPTVKGLEGLTVSHPTGIGDVDIEVKVVNPKAVNGQSYSIGWSTQADKFSGETTLLDPLDVPLWTMTGSTVLNAAATSAKYSVGMTNVVNLAGPIVGIFVLDSLGATAKNLPYVVTLGNALAEGTWTSTDGTQPLTNALAQQMARGKMSASLRTTVDTTTIPLDIQTYPYYFNRGATTLFTYQQNTSLDNTYPIFDGLQVKIGPPVWKNPTSYTWEQTDGTGDVARFYTGFGYAYSDIFPQTTNTTTQNDLVTDLEFRFTGVRVADKRSDGTTVRDTVIVSGGSIATVASSNAASIVRLRIPFEVWEIDPGTGRNRQINVVCRDRNADGLSPWGSGGAPLYIRMSTTGARAYIGAVSTVYTSDATAAGITAVPRDNPKGTWFFATAVDAGSTPTWKTGDVAHIKVPNPSVPGTDVFTFTAPPALTYDATTAKEDVTKVGVFPNPYYAFNAAETNRFSRFVTFNNLPAKATIRIFNLAGQLVKVIEKNDATAFVRWDLLNRFNFPVASGMYVAHVDMPDISATKVLKLAIIQEQEILDSY
jgi:hypothetical protein